MDIEIAFKDGTPEEQQAAKEMIERVVTSAPGRVDEPGLLVLPGAEAADVKVIHPKPGQSWSDVSGQSWDEIKAGS